MGAMLQIKGWIYGVDDHNLFECDGTNHSHIIQHGSWDGHNNGNGSWADFPYYGSDKFWFIEDNTIKGSGRCATSGGIDVQSGGRYVVRHNYCAERNAERPWHRRLGRARSCDAIRVYNNTFFWTIRHGGSLIVPAAAFGMTTLV